MATLGFALGAVLIACGLGALLVSVNLVPTDMGMLYAVCGVIAVCSGCIVVAIAALMVRIGKVPAPPQGRVWPDLAPQAAPNPALVAPTLGGGEPPPKRTEPAAKLQDTPAAAKAAPTEPEPQGKIVGRYSAGSAKYKVFSDGAIEAETEEGAFRFASMREFRAYIANRGG
jgi:hypothetical protein